MPEQFKLGHYPPFAVRMRYTGVPSTAEQRGDAQKPP
jgi:hypothetical protein